MTAEAFLATVLFSACQMMSFVLYPYFSEVTGLAPGVIVASFSVGSFLFLWGGPFWVGQAQVRGRSWALALGVLGLFVSQSLLLMMLHLPGISSGLLWCSRILYGLTASAIVPVAQMIFAEQSAEAMRMKAMTRHSLSLHLGRLLGPLLVWLGLFWGAAAPLWISVGLLALVFFMTVRATERATQVTLSHPKRFAWHQGSRRLLVLALLTTGLVGIVQASLTQHIRQEFQLTAPQAAQLTLRFLLLASLVTVVIQSVMPGVVRNPWQGTMPAGGFFLALSCFLLQRAAAVHELWYALPLFAAGLALLTPSYTAALSLQSEGSAAQLAAVHTLGYALGGLGAAGMFALRETPLSFAFLISILLVPLAFMVKTEDRDFVMSEQDVP